MKNSITVGEELRKYFYETGLNFLSSVPQRRIQEMILAMAQKGHSGKMTDWGELGAGHRTTYGHFLSKGKWDHEKVETLQRQKSFQTMLSVAEKANQPVYLSIDDTVVPKKKPSRRASRPMEGTGWHYSHLEGKKVYGYQIHAAIASTGSSTLCYSLRRCCPEHGTKVDMTLEVMHIIGIYQRRGFPATLAAQHNALGKRLPIGCGLVPILCGLPPFLRGEWDMVVGSFHFLPGCPAGGTVLTVANSLVFDAVEIVLLEGVGHKKQHRNDTSYRENQHWNSSHFAPSSRKNNKSSFQSFRVGTRILFPL